jgi:hypothetical protein
MLGLPWRLRNKCVLDRILSTERGEFDRDQLKKVKITVSIHKLAEIMPLSMNSKKRDSVRLTVVLWPPAMNHLRV